ncbi:hypothetical protein FOL47_010710, partial [Perkinsus chesapeaki]
LLLEQSRLREQVSELQHTCQRLRKALNGSVELLKIKDAEIGSLRDIIKHQHAAGVEGVATVIRMSSTGPAPLLQHMSPYKAAPKWTMKGEGCMDAQKRLDRHANKVPGPGKYDVVGKIDQTSKFRGIARPCSFGSATRFADDRSKRPKSAPGRRDKNPIEPGPGAYSPPSDFSSKPYTSQVSISFGTGGRLFPKCMEKLAQNAPGPGIYEVRNKNNRGEPTMDERAIAVAGRHDWYYDRDIIATRGKPGPGTYSLELKHDEPCMRFGTSNRPPIYHISSRGQPGPGAYDSKSTLGGLKYSFTGSSKYGGALFSPNDGSSGPQLTQPTQFGHCQMSILLFIPAVCLLALPLPGLGSIGIPAVHVEYVNDINGHFSFGFKVGYSLRAHIKAAIELDKSLLELVAWHRSSPAAQRWLELYGKSTEEAYPKVYAEMRGMSKGTGLPLDTVLLANHRNEMTLLMKRSNGSVISDGKRVERGCTDVHWATSGWVGWAHNEDYDWPVSNRPGYIVYATVYNTENQVIQRWAAYTYPLGLSGLAVSVNSDGVVSTVNSLYPTDLIVPSEQRPAIGQIILGRQLCTARSIDEAVEVLNDGRLSTGHGYNFANFKDKDSAVLYIESSPGGKIAYRNLTRYGQGSPTAHANSYIFLKGIPEDSGPSSPHRLARFGELAGSIRKPADLLKVLSDSEDSEWPIFRDRENARLQKDTGTTDFTVFITLSSTNPRIQIWTDRPWNSTSNSFSRPTTDIPLGEGSWIRQLSWSEDEAASLGFKGGVEEAFTNDYVVIS